MPPRKLSDLPGAAERQARLLAEINADANAAMARAEAEVAARPGAASAATRPLAGSPSGPSRALVPAPIPAPAASPDRATTYPDALSAELASLGDTLDMMATLTASVSDRVDGQTAALAKLAGVAAEARQAAFAARTQADPGKLATEVERVLGAALLPHLRGIVGAVERLDRAGGDRESLHQLRGQASDLARDLRRARERAALWRARLPGIGAASLLLVLVLIVALPRLALSHPLGCRLLGGDWRDWTLSGDGTSCRFEWP